MRNLIYGNLCDSWEILLQTERNYEDENSEKRNTLP